MPRFWESWWQRLRDMWGRTSLAQRILVGGALVTLLLVFVLLIYWMNQTEYGVLYSGMSQKDASSVVDYFKQQNIPYKLANNGSTIKVPKGKVHDLRLQLAGQNVLQGGGVGFEIFSENQIGQTDFVQQVNYQRALQGELARTISAAPIVQSARVHLVLPEKSLFIEEQNPASASVLLNLKKHREMDQKQVKSIVNLVASAVEGLSQANITVTDTAGNLLYEPNQEDGLNGLTDKQLEYKVELERRLVQRIKQLLIPVIGPGKVMAQVNLDLDLSQKTIHKELFDPESSVVRSEQKTRESSSGRANVESGTPGPQYQGEQGQGTGTTRESSRSRQTVNYEINKEEHDIVLPQGGIKQLSAAVLVDGTYKTNKQGNQVFVPRKKSEIEQIQNLVKRAIGFNPKRGDSIEVTSMAFGRPQKMPEPSWWQEVLDYAQNFWKPLLNAVIILLFLLLVVRPIILAIIKPRVTEEEEEAASGLPEAEGREALTEGISEEEIAAREAKKGFEDLKAKAGEIIDKNRDEAMNIIKQWMREEVRR